VKPCHECGGDGITVIPCNCGAYAAEHGCGGIKAEKPCDYCDGTGEVEDDEEEQSS
jgi:hypothetical protein